MANGVRQLALDAQRVIRDQFQKSKYFSLSINKAIEFHREISDRVQKSKYVPLSIRRKPSAIYSLLLIFLIILGVFSSLFSFSTGQYDSAGTHKLLPISIIGVPQSATMVEDNLDLGRLSDTSPISDTIIDYFKGETYRFISNGFSSVLSDQAVHENLKDVGRIGCRVVRRGSQRLETYQSDIMPFEISEVGSKLLNQNKEYGLINRISIWLDHYSINLVLTETFNTKDDKLQLLLEPFNKAWDLVTNSDKNDGRFLIEATSYEHGVYGDKYEVQFPRMVELSRDARNLKLLKIYNQFGDEEPFLIYEHHASLFVYNIFSKKTVQLQDTDSGGGRWMPLVDNDVIEGVMVDILVITSVYRCDVVTGQCHKKSMRGVEMAHEQSDITTLVNHFQGGTTLFSLSPMLQNIEGLEDLGVSINTFKHFYVGFMTLKQNMDVGEEASVYASHIVVLYKDTSDGAYEVTFISEAMFQPPFKNAQSCDPNYLIVAKGIAAWDVISINKKTKSINDYMVVNTDKGKVYFHGLLNFLTSVGTFDRMYSVQSGEQRMNSIDLVFCALDQSLGNCDRVDRKHKLVNEHLMVVESSEPGEPTSE